MSVSAGQRPGRTEGGEPDPGEPGELVVEQQPAPPVVRRIVWWRELLLAVLGYAVYAAGRSLHGETLDANDVRIADAHGHAILHLEQRWGVAWEHAVQDPFLPHRTLIKAVGGFYGGAHFIVTIGVLLWLLFRRPAHYRFWRSVLFTATFASTIIFALWPALPPRLLPVGERTVDTLDVIGGLWSYNHGVLEHISDPYAPMPSLHLAWATWVAVSLAVALPARRWWQRAVLALYPVAIYLAVIITGTHFVVDGVAGMLMLGLSVVAVAVTARLLRRVRWRRLTGGADASAPTPVAVPY